MEMYGKQKLRFSLGPLLAIGALLLATAQLRGQADTWVGNSATTSNWSDAANWQANTLPQNGDALTFQGSNRTTNTNDLMRADYDSFTFAANAAAFNLQGFGEGLLANGITNNSSNTQTISFSVPNPFTATITGLSIIQDQTWNAASGNLSIQSTVQGGRINTFGLVTLTVSGGFDTAISGLIRDDPAQAANTLALVKNGAGTLTITNDNTYTGGTTLNAGVLAAGSTNPFGTGSVTVNGGTLQTANGPRTVNIGGNYTQNSGGTLRLLIGGPAPGMQSDLLSVTGTASLGGTLSLVRINNFMPTQGQRVEIIDDAAGHSGTFASVVSDFTGTLRPVVHYDEPLDIYILFEQVSFSGMPGLTFNQRAVARELDNVINDPRAADLIDFLLTEDPGALPHDFDLIAPEELASIYEIGFSQSVVQNANLQHRMDDIRAGSTGFCGNGFVATTSGKDEGKNVASEHGKVVLPASNPSMMESVPDNRWGVFVTGSGNFVNVGNEDENAHGYDITTGDVTLGVDYRLGKHFAIGLDGGYSGSGADLVDRGRVEVDGGKAGAYATVYGFKLLGAEIHVDGAVSGGWNTHDTWRTGLAGETVRGSTDGSEFNALLAYGGDYHFGCLLLGTWSTLQYTNVGIDSFTESGSLAPLHFPDQDEDSFRTTSGIRIAYDAKFGHTIVRPEVRAAWQHECNDRVYPIEARFASGAGDVFTVHGPSIGRDSALVDAGIAVLWTPRISTYIYYDGVLGRGNYENHAVSGGVRLTF